MSDIPTGRTTYRGQHRLVRLQTVDWGTFDGYKAFPIDLDGTLFTGGSGTGKSSLLDALSIVLLSSTEHHFNASADMTAAGAHGAGRNIAGYVRGAWSESADEDTKERAVRYLRDTGATWSAVAATFGDGDGHVTTAVAIKWFTDTSTEGATPKSLYQIHDGDFDLRVLDPDWAQAPGPAERPFNLGAFKKRHPDAYVTDKQNDYLKRLARKIGLGGSASARALLGRAKAMKNVGDLDRFIRTNMLDVPDTYAACTAMLESYEPLSTAYQTARRAADQMEVLKDFPHDWTTYTELSQRHDLIDDLLGDPIIHYMNGQRLQAAENESERLSHHLVDLAEQLRSANLRVTESERGYGALKTEFEQRGAGLRQLEAEMATAKDHAKMREQAFGRYKAAVERLDRPCPSTAEEFEELREQLENIGEAARDGTESLNQPRLQALQHAGALDKEHSEATAELKALQSAPSLIGKDATRRRQDIASGTGIPVNDLPYTAELLDVAPGQEQWRPAAEKLLRNFGKRLLIPERHREAVTAYVDSNNMRGILEFDIIGDPAEPAPIDADTLAGKITVDDAHPAAHWLRNHVTAAFAHVCVDDVSMLAEHPLAVTLNGTIKRPGEHYRKDDRPELLDPARFILGANTIAKREALEAKVGELTRQLSDAQAEVEEVDREYQRLTRLATAADDVAGWDDWTELDHVGAKHTANALSQQISEMKAADTGLGDLEQRCADAKEQWMSAIREAGRLKDEQDKCSDLETAVNDRIPNLEQQPRTIDPGHREYLDQVLEAESQTVSIENSNIISNMLRRRLRERLEVAGRERKAAHDRVERTMTTFLSRWAEAVPDTSGDVEGSGPDFVLLTEEIGQRRLRDAIGQLRELIGNELLGRITQLSNDIEAAADEIKKGVRTINTVLARVPYDTGQDTRLRIDYDAKPSAAAREFNDTVHKLLERAAAAETKKEGAVDLDQFREVRDLMAKFKDDSSEGRAWREGVLDVRLTYRFYGREVLPDGTTARTYSNAGANSGGEQEKLVAFCLAAALSYNLSDDDTAGLPRFAPLMLDEAFSKSDEHFSSESLNVFDEFGFQLIMAAPIRMSGIVAPYIGSALMVTRQRHSNGMRSFARPASFEELAGRAEEEDDA